jgi:hypothetical protein
MRTQSVNSADAVARQTSDDRSRRSSFNRHGHYRIDLARGSLSGIGADRPVAVHHNIGFLLVIPTLNFQSFRFAREMLSNRIR